MTMHKRCVVRRAPSYVALFLHCSLMVHVFFRVQQRRNTAWRSHWRVGSLPSFAGYLDVGGTGPGSGSSNLDRQQGTGVAVQLLANSSPHVPTPPPSPECSHLHEEDCDEGVGRVDSRAWNFEADVASTKKSTGRSYRRNHGRGQGNCRKGTTFAAMMENLVFIFPVRLRL